MDASGNYKSEFVYGPAGLISHSRSRLGTVFFAYDERGNVQSVWRDTGALVSSRVYDAYGAQTGGIVASSTYDDPEIGYNGQAGYITDPETGLVLCGHRYYDPSAGRWLNRDPIGYAGGINTYRYCGNNPVMWDDPTGLLDFASSGGANLGFGVPTSVNPWANNAPNQYTMDPPPFDPLSDTSQYCADHPGQVAMMAGSILDGLGEAALGSAAVAADGGAFTAIGRMNDIARYDNVAGIDTWAKSGRIPGPGEPRVTWRENRQWLDHRINRGDTFILATDPDTLSNVYVPNQPNGYFTWLEIQHLNKNGISPLEMWP